MSNLVIVESPAKAKTIGKYLGPGYEVIASKGHIRDLPEKQMGVEIKSKDDIKVRYINIPGQADAIKKLKDRASRSEKIYLATDPDREGEAISWHLAKLLKLDMDDENRVTFGEITKKGIQTGMDNVRKIDTDLVDAQQGRRVLDRILGYRLSPFLWKMSGRHLSAGRVQSVALKLIVDRHREILRFDPQEYWNITATLSPRGSNRKFKASYYGSNGKKKTVTDGERAEKIKKESEAAEFIIKKVTKGEKRRVPAPPFSTSTLQQEASRKLGFNARRTMSTAQDLYEGMNVEGYGTIGLITYMRTDSLRISDEAYYAARSFIKESYGDKYIPPYRRNYKSRTNSQDAHEAIRPTNVQITPEIAKKSLPQDAARLYKLVWERFMASQMADCIQETVNVDIDAANHQYKASGYTVLFNGYTVLYEEGTDEKKEKETALPPLDESTQLKLRSLETEQKFTQPPSEYTEATLIKALEENGIGRPSTYAPTISTLEDRRYVEKTDKKLIPTELGETVTDLLGEYFSNIVNVKFTAQMEDSLDRIASGDMKWENVVYDYRETLSDELRKAEDETRGVKITVTKINRDEPTDKICPECGKPMVIKHGKNGRFLACTGFPDCKHTEPIIEYAKGICPVCGSRMKKLMSKKHHIFFACENNDCQFMSWEEPTGDVCPSCGKTLFRKMTKTAKPHCVNEACDRYVPFPPARTSRSRRKKEQ